MLKSVPKILKSDKITIKGAREHNLKNIDLDILKVFPEVETEIYIENHVRIWKA